MKKAMEQFQLPPPFRGQLELPPDLGFLAVDVVRVLLSLLHLQLFIASSAFVRPAHFRSTLFFLRSLHFFRLSFAFLPFLSFPLCPFLFFPFLSFGSLTFLSFFCLPLRLFSGLLLPCLSLSLFSFSCLPFRTF